MSANGAAARRTRPAASLSIGQVQLRLGAEFPDLTPSKLRFLEEQGLLHPDRTPAGYRKFTERDVDRVRTILQLQRDHYLPLRVIGEYLEAVDRGEQPKLPGAESTSQSRSILFDGELVSRQQLQRQAGASRELLDQALQAQLLPRQQHYTQAHVQLLATLVTLERRGIEPRHLRAFRTSVHHELGLIEQVVSSLGRRNDASSRKRAEAVAAEVAEQLACVRRGLIQQGVAGSGN